MEIKEPELKFTVEKSADALWEDFERTGSVQTYLQFLQKAKIQNEAEIVNPPFRP